MRADLRTEAAHKFVAKGAAKVISRKLKHQSCRITRDEQPNLKHILVNKCSFVYALRRHRITQFCLFEEKRTHTVVLLSLFWGLLSKDVISRIYLAKHSSLMRENKIRHSMSSMTSSA